jgi:hypothetical protein
MVGCEFLFLSQQARRPNLCDWPIVSLQKIHVKLANHLSKPPTNFLRL